MEEVITAHPSKVCGVSECVEPPLYQTTAGVFCSVPKFLPAAMQLRLLYSFIASASVPENTICKMTPHGTSGLFSSFFFVCLFHLLSVRATFESINRLEVECLCTFVLPATPHLQTPPSEPPGFVDSGAAHICVRFRFKHLLGYVRSSHSICVAL